MPHFRGLLFLVIILTVGTVSCSLLTKPGSNLDYKLLEGGTMGTYYKVTCKCPVGLDVKISIDSLLLDINSIVSVYEPESFISTLNRASENTIWKNLPRHFRINLERSNYWYDMSDGYFDVSTMPITNYWGFGYTANQAVTFIDSIMVDSLQSMVGLDKWTIYPDSLIKNMSGQQLDFGAIAKGYAVDEVGTLLSNAGCTDYLVDIGGELIAKGVNRNGQSWIIGISTPKSDAPMVDYQVLLQLDHLALASSGNYRNFYQVDNQKYGHTINPKTGYPYQDELLAVSILADRCIDADAIATACMAMGYLKATTFISKMPDISACFLVGAADGSIQIKYKNGFIQYVLES